MKGKKIKGAAILLFAGLALALYFLNRDPLREVHALWEETMSRTEGAYVQTVTGSAWETKDAPGSENGERSGGTESSTAVTKVWYGMVRMNGGSGTGWSCFRRKRMGA